MNTTKAKTFTCCGTPFIYYPEVDKLGSPPDAQRIKIMHKYLSKSNLIF